MENAQPEPSMEEILASIRRIISEDDEEAPASTAETAKPALKTPPPARKPEPAAKPSLVEPAPREPEPEPQFESDDANPHLETEDIEMLKKNVAEAASVEVEDAILDTTAADAASQAFQSLSQSVRVSEGPGRTLEDLVIEMLRPMVKDWLDHNLPSIVEEKVEEEVQRVARRRR